MEKAIPNTTKACIHRSKKSTTTQKKQKPGLANFYDTWLGNAAGLFSKEKIREEIRKK